MKYNVNLGFEKGDIVYQIIDGVVQKEKRFKIHQLEVEEGGNFHDGFEETHNAYLEDMDTQFVEKCKVAFINLMCQIKYIYFVKCNE